MQWKYFNLTTFVSTKLQYDAQGWLVKCVLKEFKDISSTSFKLQCLSQKKPSTKYNHFQSLTSISFSCRKCIYRTYNKKCGYEKLNY